MLLYPNPNKNHTFFNRTGYFQSFLVAILNDGDTNEDAKNVQYRPVLLRRLLKNEIESLDLSQVGKKKPFLLINKRFLSGRIE